jgi:hypothetical protein
MAPALPPEHAEQLLALHAAAAISYGFAQGPGCSALRVCDMALLASLRARGLTARRHTRSLRGRPLSLYWLTPAGLDLARRLKTEA